MIKIYQKSPAEISKQQSDYNFGAQITKGVPYKACPTYVVISGEKKDTWNLTELEILSLIANDVADYTRDMDAYSKRRGKSSVDSFDLIKSLKSDFDLSAEGNLYLLGLEKKYGTHILMDILGKLTKNKLLNKARIIAQFNKESSGDFSNVEFDEVYAIVEQMASNEFLRRMQKRSR